MGVPDKSYFRFKGFVFMMFLTGIILSIAGVAYFHDMYFIMSTFILSFYLFKSVSMAAGVIINYFRYSQIIKEIGTFDAKKVNDLSTHVIVVPNFKEDVQVIRETISNLASHPYAKTYCVFMAMEQRETGCVEKFLKLKQEFSTAFRIFSYTLHEEQEGEAKSKNSNINWCVTHCVPTLLEHGIHLDDTFITIMDADSLMPYIYMDQVNKHISENYERRHKFIYQPNQVFTRNDKDVYFFVRLSDIIMSYLHNSNHYSVYDFTFGVSNYTTSYRHLERVGFWDTCEFSRTEDFRIVSKSYWITEGDFYTVPISTPFNQLSLNTGNGFIADFKARFQQAIRHNLSQIEASYAIASFLKSKTWGTRDFYVLIMTLDPYFCVALIPMTIIFGVLQHVLKIVPHSQYDDGTFFLIYNIMHIFFFLLGFPFHEATKRRITSEIYGLKNMNIFHLFTMPFAVTPISILIGQIPLIIAGIRLTTGMKYVHQVAPKNIQKNFNDKRNSNFVLKALDPEQVQINSQEIHH